MWKRSSWGTIGLVVIIFIVASASISALVMTLLNNQQVKPYEDAVQDLIITQNYCEARMAVFEKELSELRRHLREDELNPNTVFYDFVKKDELSEQFNNLDARMSGLEELNIIDSERLGKVESRVDLLEKSPLPEEAQSGRRPEPDDQLSQHNQFDQHIDWVHA